mgnify:CR=1 FL=1
MAKEFGISKVTLRRWVRDGKIKSVKTAGGHNRYAVSQEAGIEQPAARRRIAYCRVSSPKQRGDLERQEEMLRSTYPQHEIIKDIGSGLNYKRRGFLQLVDAIMCGSIEEIVVAHRDRLTRFGFPLIEHLCNKTGARLVVLDHEVRSTERELSDDLMAIVHSFSCRAHGMRWYARRGDSRRENTPAAGGATSEEAQVVDKLRPSDLQPRTALGEDPQVEA